MSKQRIILIGSLVALVVIALLAIYIYQGVTTATENIDIVLTEAMMTRAAQP